MTISGTAASAFEIGQFCFKKATFSLKVASSRPGTTATVSSSILVTVGPSPSVTVALVSMLVGGLPALVSCAARNIEKQPACAAPISSSGFVPSLPPSKRDLNVNGALKAPLPPATEPEPSLSVPFHCAFAFETAMVVGLLLRDHDLMPHRAANNPPARFWRCGGTHQLFNAASPGGNLASMLRCGRLALGISVALFGCARGAPTRLAAAPALRPAVAPPPYRAPPALAAAEARVAVPPS